MKKILLLGLLLFAMWGVAQAEKVEPYASCKPYTRWWWFTEVIQKQDIREQLIWAKEVGLGGVEIAWIRPQSKVSRQKPIQGQEWLSPEWAEMVAYAKHCADSLGLGCDYTYGSAWPFMDPDLPEKYGSRSYWVDESQAKRRGGWFYPRYSRILDHLNSKAFKWYANRMDSGLKKAYAGSTSAIFVDSWEINARGLWTKGLGDKFFKRFGYRIEPLMDEVYNKGNEDLYYDFMEVLGEQAINEFYKPFTKHAHKVKAITRSQCNGSPTDLLSAYMVVDVPETEALLYEPYFGRIAASAATLANKPVVSAETFTCIYGFHPIINIRGPFIGREQIADMRLVADALLANGTNQIIWHGMPYNKVGSKYHHFYASVHLSPTAYFIGQLKEFNDYMARVSSYMRRGNNYSDVALYLPVEDSHRTWYYPKHLRIPGTSGQFQLRYVAAPEYLEGYQPTWVNREVVTGAKVRNGRMIYNQTSFSALIIDVKYVDIASLRHILRLAKAGLPIVLAQTPAQPGRNKSPEYAEMLKQIKALPNVSQQPDAVLKSVPRLIEGKDLPEFWCREENGDKYIFIANPAACRMHFPLRYCQAFEDKGSVRDVVINTATGPKPMKLQFKPNESILLKVAANGSVEQIALNFKAKRIEGPGIYE